MARSPLLSVEKARAELEDLHETTEAAEPNLLVPTDWIKRLHDVVRSIAPRDSHHRYRLDGVLGITMGRLHRRVDALLRDFDGLVEDNPRLTRK